MVRGRVSATVDPKVERDVRLEQQLRERFAADSHTEQPIFAHTVEDILKKGLKVCRAERESIRRQ